MQTQTKSNKKVSPVYVSKKQWDLTFPWRANSRLIKHVRQQMNFNNGLEIQFHGTFLKITNCL